MNLLAKSSGEYVPNQGDLIWISFDPVVGHEQRGHRPALVLSPHSYNAFGYLLCVPITSRIKTYAFAVLIVQDAIKGSVLCDQIKCVDWKERGISFIGCASSDLVQEVSAKLSVLLP